MIVGREAWGFPMRGSISQTGQDCKMVASPTLHDHGIVYYCSLHRKVLVVRICFLKSRPAAFPAAFSRMASPPMIAGLSVRAVTPDPAR